MEEAEDRGYQPRVHRDLLVEGVGGVDGEAEAEVGGRGGVMMHHHWER
jgi:hypothetical protein